LTLFIYLLLLLLLFIFYFFDVGECFVLDDLRFKS
jgi:hypothetical protein